MRTLSRVSFWALMLLAAIYAGQLAHAAIVEATTDPAACKIVTTTLLPAPVCPGLGWSQHTLFLLSLPGAYLSYPFEIGLRTSNPMVLANPQFIIIMLMHFFGWGYAASTLARCFKQKRSHPTSQQ